MTLRILLAVGSAFVIAICSASIAVASSDSALRSVNGVRAAQAETIPGSCGSYRTGEEVPVTFTDQGGPKRLHLLLDRTVVRPGQRLRMAPLNLSRKPVSYGLETAAEEVATGSPLAGTGFFIPLIGLSADPGQVGSCATLNVPNTAPLGDYRAVLKHVDGAGLTDDDLEAPFTIAGEPLNAGPFVPAGARSVGSRVHGNFSERKLNRAAEQIAKVLRDEPSRSWGIGHRNRRRLTLEITELTVKGFKSVDRVATVPLRVRVASG